MAYFNTFPREKTGVGSGKSVVSGVTKDVATAFENDIVSRKDPGLSIQKIENDMLRFRFSRFQNDHYLSQWDCPSTTYFKIFFYFNGFDGNSMVPQGLLGLAHTDMVNDLYDNLFGEGASMEKVNQYKNSDGSYSFANTALNYLLINNEIEHAQQLYMFIDLLSKINMYSPWYWQKVEGLGDSLEQVYKDKYEPIKLKITTLPDSADNRIGTLLDLYKSACYSQSRRCEVVPANLRRFDMGIFLFEAPSAYNREQGITSNADSTMNFKYFELTDCEIQMDSIGNAYNVFETDEAKEVIHEIPIIAKTCKEDRYNAWLGAHIGDFLHADCFPNSATVHQETEKLDMSVLNSEILNFYHDYGYNSNIEKLDGHTQTADQMVLRDFIENKARAKLMLRNNIYKESAQSVIAKAATKVTNLFDKNIAKIDRAPSLGNITSETTKNASKLVDKL